MNYPDAICRLDEFGNEHSFNVYYQNAAIMVGIPCRVGRLSVEVCLWQCPGDNRERKPQGSDLLKMKALLH